MINMQDIETVVKSFGYSVEIAKDRAYVKKLGMTYGDLSGCSGLVQYLRSRGHTVKVESICFAQWALYFS